MQEIEDHLADRESAIANEKADRKDLIDSDRPNWRNSLADLLEWQDRHGVTPEELTDKESVLLAVAEYISLGGISSLLKARAEYYHQEFVFLFFADSRCEARIKIDANGVQSLQIGIYASGNEPISAGSVKSFFSND